MKSSTSISIETKLKINSRFSEMSLLLIIYEHLQWSSRGTENDSTLVIILQNIFKVFVTEL